MHLAPLANPSIASSSDIFPYEITHGLDLEGDGFSIDNDNPIDVSRDVVLFHVEHLLLFDDVDTGFTKSAQDGLLLSPSLAKDEFSFNIVEECLIPLSPPVGEFSLAIGAKHGSSVGVTWIGLDVRSSHVIDRLNYIW